MGKQRQPQWRGLRAKTAAWWFGRPVRTRIDAAALDAIGGLVRPDDTVLDLGAGTGYFTLAVASLLARGKVIALDESRDMLAGLVRRAGERQLAEKIDTVVADATRSGLPDVSVDLVISANLLHELPDPRAAIHEMARVLRPEGCVVIQDFRDGVVGRLLKAVYHRHARGPLSATEIGGMLDAAGFLDVTVTLSGLRYLAAGRKNSQVS